MSSIQEIPLSPKPQTFAIALASVRYQMTLQWRNGIGWVLDIADVSGNALVNGMPLVTGADLLAPYPQMGFGGQLRVLTDHGVDAPPTFENLGVTGHVYFVVM